MRSVPLFVLVAVVFAGCGPTPTEFCSSLSQKMAVLQHGCSGGPTDLIKDVIQKGCTTGIEGQVTHKRGTYDAEKAAQCLKALDSVTCLELATPTSTAVQACSTVVKGTVAIGGTCLFEQDCANGAACVKTDATECTGKCAAKKAPGEACKAASDCDSGGTSKVAVCTPSTDTCAQNPAPTHTEAAVGETCGDGAKVCAKDSTCASSGPNLTCVAIVREGSPCTVGNNQCEFYTSCKAGICTRFNGVGGSCGENGSATEEPSFCINGSCANGTCVALKAEGGSCTSYADCESLSCVSGACAATCDESRP